MDEPEADPLLMCPGCNTAVFAVRPDGRCALCSDTDSSGKLAEWVADLARFIADLTSFAALEDRIDSQIRINDAIEAKKGRRPK